MASCKTFYSNYVVDVRMIYVVKWLSLILITVESLIIFLCSCRLPVSPYWH